MITNTKTNTYARIDKYPTDNRIDKSRWAESPVDRVVYQQIKTIQYMELNKLVTGDIIIARYGSEYREMEVLSNDVDREQIAVNVTIEIGTFSSIKKMMVLEYGDYNLEKWGKLQKKTVEI